MENNKKIPEQSGGTGKLRDEGSKAEIYMSSSTKAYARKIQELKEKGISWEPYNPSIFSAEDKIFLLILVLMTLSIPVLFWLLIAFFGVSA